MGRFYTTWSTHIKSSHAEHTITMAQFNTTSLTKCGSHDHVSYGKMWLLHIVLHSLTNILDHMIIYKLHN